MNVSAPLAFVETTEAMASFSRQLEAVITPVSRQFSQLTETLRKVGELIAQSPYVRAKKTKARLVAFLLELLVRSRRSRLNRTPTSGVVALEFSTLNDDGPPTFVPVLATHRGSNAPNAAQSFTTRTATSRVSGLNRHSLSKVGEKEKRPAGRTAKS